MIDAADWKTEPPDSGREVLALYRRSTGGRLESWFRHRVIVACFGSEGKWVACDHDRRLTYLDEGTVLGWRELPEIPEQLRSHERR